MRQIILDTETTGLNPKEGHRIIEIGCVELVRRKFTGNNFHCYINPERQVDIGALKVHGLSNTFLADKPIFKDIYKEFIDYIDGAEVIIHNAPFDVGFLNHEFKLINKKEKLFASYCDVIDSLVMARKKHPGQRNSLDALCKRYHVDNSDRELHGALLDARILGQVYLAMTGGQESLFDNDEPLHQSSLGTKNAEEMGGKRDDVAKIWDLPVIAADKSETQQHQDYLKRITQEDDQ